MSSKRNVLKIAHLGDIHVQANYDFSIVFNNLYEDLRLVKPDLIVLCGDVFHNKTSAKACLKYFKKVQEINSYLIFDKK